MWNLPLKWHLQAVNNCTSELFNLIEKNHKRGKPAETYRLDWHGKYLHRLGSAGLMDLDSRDKLKPNRPWHVSLFVDPSSDFNFTDHRLSQSISIIQLLMHLNFGTCHKSECQSMICTCDPSRNFLSVIEWFHCFEWRGSCFTSQGSLDVVETNHGN